MPNTKSNHVISDVLDVAGYYFTYPARLSSYPFAKYGFDSDPNTSMRELTSRMNAG